MKTVYRFTSLITALLLAATACSAETDESGSSADAITDSPKRSEAWSDPLFQEHPHTGTFTLKSGVTAPTPSWYPDASTTIVFGLADLAPLRQIARGSGYQPVTTKDKTKGIVRLYVDKCSESDLGSNHEFIVSFDADPVGTAYPWVNAYSILVPSLANPQTAIFMHKLALDEKLPIDYGREVYGYDKHMTKIRFSGDASDSMIEFAITDNRGSERGVYGSFTFDRSPAAQLTTAQGLAAAFGLADPTQLPPAPPVGTYDVVTHDVMSKSPSAFKFQRAYFKWSPVINEFGSQDSLSFDVRDELGKFLKDVKFEPTIIMHDPHTKGVFEEAPPRK